MIKKLIMITSLILILPIIQSANAEEVPAWIKNNAGWWAEGTITEKEFVQAIQFLIKEDIIQVPPTAVSEQKSTTVPDWVKNSAGWWADGAITDGEFLNGIQFLIKAGIIDIPRPDKAVDDVKVQPSGELEKLQAQLDECQNIKKAYQRLDCEKPIKAEMKLIEFKDKSDVYVVGPVTFYYPGIGLLGNTFEITSSGQAMLNLQILAENTGSSDNVSLMCTGPAICSYDITNGDRTFKYSGMDFTNGQIVLKPGESREFNMLFGPNIGYGGTKFEYDPSKEYFFRISESFGSQNIPLNLE